MAAKRATGPFASRRPDQPRIRRGQSGRGREIRTPDTLLPKQVRYQTAPYPGSIKTTGGQRPAEGARMILAGLAGVKRMCGFNMALSRSAT